MGGRLTSPQKKTIERFVGTGAKDFKFLYSFTQNGANGKTFHQICDNQGPTVTVVYNTNGSVYGGYIEKSWVPGGSGKYYKDDQAFLFRLMYEEKAILNRFPVKNPDKAFYCNEDSGPVFGSGHDLSLFKWTLYPNGTEYTLNGQMTLCDDYDMCGITADQITGGIRTVIDVEVYSLTKSPLADVWRECPGWEMKDLQELKQFAYSFSPPQGLGTDTANILVIGPVGAGKSSFFNTIASVFRGHISNQAVCGSAEKSITFKYQMYRVRGSQMDKPLKLCLCDTMGLEESIGMDAQELSYILDGRVPNGYQFNPPTPISSDIHGYVKKPTLGNKIHCVCFVLDGSTATILSEKMVEKLKSMQAKVRQKGLPHAILLTKIDNVCSNVEEDVTHVYKSDTIRRLVDQVSNMFGVPRNLILPLKNYEKEIDVKTDVSILAMLTLKRLLLSAEDHLFNFLDKLENTQKSG